MCSSDLLRALAGFVALLTEPQCGRINGRLARDSRPAMLTGGIRLSRLPGPLPAPHPPVRPDVVQPARRDAVQAARPEVAQPARPDAVRPEDAPVQAGARPDPVGRPRAPRPPGPSPVRDGARPATRPAPTPLQALLAASAGKED